MRKRQLVWLVALGLAAVGCTPEPGVGASPAGTIEVTTTVFVSSTPAPPPPTTTSEPTSTAASPESLVVASISPAWGIQGQIVVVSRDGSWSTYLPNGGSGPADYPLLLEARPVRSGVLAEADVAVLTATAADESLRSLAPEEGSPPCQQTDGTAFTYLLDGSVDLRFWECSPGAKEYLRGLSQVIHGRDLWLDEWTPYRDRGLALVERVLDEGGALVRGQLVEADGGVAVKVVATSVAAIDASEPPELLSMPRLVDPADVDALGRFPLSTEVAVVVDRDHEIVRLAALQGSELVDAGPGLDVLALGNDLHVARAFAYGEVPEGHCVLHPELVRSEPATGLEALVRGLRIVVERQELREAVEATTRRRESPDLVAYEVPVRGGDESMFVGFYTAEGVSWGWVHGMGYRDDGKPRRRTAEIEVPPGTDLLVYADPDDAASGCHATGTAAEFETLRRQGVLVGIIDWESRNDMSIDLDALELVPRRRP